MDAEQLAGIRERCIEAHGRIFESYQRNDPEKQYGMYIQIATASILDIESLLGEVERLQEGRERMAGSYAQSIQRCRKLDAEVERLEVLGQKRIDLNRLLSLKIGELKTENAALRRERDAAKADIALLLQVGPREACEFCKHNGDCGRDYSCYRKAEWRGVREVMEG